MCRTSREIGSLTRAIASCVKNRKEMRPYRTLDNAGLYLLVEVVLDNLRISLFDYDLFYKPDTSFSKKMV